ncbi:MAG: hypothetical protein DMD26_16520 [Gemmatimonadetes bacterium]|nr:MAG: hypothetical protein DMD26_16520 [Gemmatimonadota bacterium]
MLQAPDALTQPVVRTLEVLSDVPNALLQRRGSVDVSTGGDRVKSRDEPAAEDVGKVLEGEHDVVARPAGSLRLGRQRRRKRESDDD